MAKGKKKTDVLMRTEKWELRTNPEQEKLLVQLSGGLREIYNWGLEQWMDAYKLYREKKKIWENLPLEARTLLQKLVSAGMVHLVDGCELSQPSSVSPELWEKLQAGAVVFPLPKLPTFFDQVNQLTGMKKGGTKIPRNWKEETLDSLHGALKSFFKLREKGDPDARPPKPRSEGRFSAIPGRSGFSIHAGRLVLAPNIFGKETLSFPIPSEYQARMLARASKMLKFVISRDEPYLAKPGRYWISVSYEFPKPEMKPFIPEQAVYVALGASSIGVVSPKGAEVIPLWRSDKHWKPKTDAIEWWLEWKGWGTNFRPVQKGSKRWRKLMGKRGKMFGIMGAQQTQDRREVVAIDLLDRAKREQHTTQPTPAEEWQGLLGFLGLTVEQQKARVESQIFAHGEHFVVTDYVVRSKEGKLADSSKVERRGSLGKNWMAQNTGSIGYLAQWLEEKAPEYGGTVRRHKLPYESLPPDLPKGHENKILMAHVLRDDFLRSFSGSQ